MPSKLQLSYPDILRLFGSHAVKQRTESRQFLAWFLENYYRLEEGEIDDCICDGNYDKGVDGIYVNEQLAQIDVFQGRIVKGPKTQGDVSLKEFMGTVSQFGSAKSVKNMQATTKNTELAGLLQEQDIAKKVAEGYEVRGIFLTNAKRDQNAIDFLKTAEDLVLYDEIELQKSYVPINKTEPIAADISFDVSSVPTMEYPMGSLTMVIAPLAAEELVKMQGISNGELFAWNVRQWLKKTKVNKDIELSIKKQDEHKYFPAFHNGLTVLCKHLRLKKDKITVSGYAVVNGCQSLTGLYENKKRLSSDLRILTKFIQISPETPLALKITDHTNNQNGTTARDLQSNNPIQTRLQQEINSGKFRYRIKRGEHPDWHPERVIENELAARILLAFDVKQPWSCHQTYKLFDELHSDIFGRPEVDGLRVTTMYNVYRLVIAKLDLFENQLFAHYTITRFLVLYLLREALEKDPLGKEFCLRPAQFLSSSAKRARLEECIDKVTKVVVRFLDSEVKRRDADPSAPFDYKRELKSPNSVREIASTIVSHYQIAVDSKFATTFSDSWKQHGNGKREPARRRSGKRK
jgi:AIPR protein